jgi:hypothetical protein
MPQQLADLVQRRSLAQQFGRGGMPEAMRCDLTDPGALARRHDHLGHAARGQRPARRLDPHEHLPAGEAGRAAVAEIDRDRLANIRG